MFSFNHINHDLQFPQLNTEYHHGHRYYITPEGNRYLSVTTFLDMITDKSGLEKWKKDVGEDVAKYIKNESAGVGTAYHNIIETFLKNENVYEKHKNIFALAHFENVKPYLYRIDNIWALEKTLYSDAMHLAGRVDAVADYFGKKSVIDFKTSRKQKKEEWIQNYFLQATTYAMCWSELFPNAPQIEQIVIVVSSSHDSTSDIFAKPIDNYIEQLTRLINNNSAYLVNQK